MTKKCGLLLNVINLRGLQTPIEITSSLERMWLRNIVLAMKKKNRSKKKFLKNYQKTVQKNSTSKKKY